VTARALLAVHGVLGLVAVFAVSRDAVIAVLSAARREVVAYAAAGFGWLAASAISVQFAVGLALYPSYRVHVRAADFDRHAPVYSQLFDFKEHLAALSLALVVVTAFARPARPRATTTNGATALSAESAVHAEGARWPLAAVATTAALLVWTVAILGVCVTARHPV
jgi:hypothetical protein